MARASLIAASAIACTALLAGCKGGGDKAATTTTSTSPGTVVQGYHVLATLVFHESEYKLDPKTVGLRIPGYFGVKAVNDGTVPHALAVEGPGGVSERTPTVAPGESKTIAVYFKKTGLYRVFCPIDGHAQRGMRATIRVL